MSGGESFQLPPQARGTSSEGLSGVPSSVSPRAEEVHSSISEGVRFGGNSAAVRNHFAARVGKGLESVGSGRPLPPERGEMSGKDEARRAERAAALNAELGAARVTGGLESVGSGRPLPPERGEMSGKEEARRAARAAALYAELGAARVTGGLESVGSEPKFEKPTTASNVLASLKSFGTTARKCVWGGIKNALGIGKAVATHSAAGAAPSVATTPSGIPQFTFNGGGSGKLIKLKLKPSDAAQGLTRADFRKAESRWETPPPVIGKSPWVSTDMVQHLMKDKRDSAIATKYEHGATITNMEGALHTFVTPVVKSVMTRDYKYDQHHSSIALNGGREVLLSASIQFDCEKSKTGSRVMLDVFELGDTEVSGKPLPDDFSILSAEDKKDPVKRAAYDQHLRHHMISHLTEAGKLPAKDDVLHIMNPSECKTNLEILCGPLFRPPENKYVEINGHVLTLEAMFNAYLEQLRNEFKVLEQVAPDSGYIYTIDPPSIFLDGIAEGVPPNERNRIKKEAGEILNRLQALAFRQLSAEMKLEKLKCVAFNNFADTPMIGVLKQALSGTQNEDVHVEAKRTLFPPEEGGTYKPPDGLETSVLVLHNNSDAFGQNIETEGATSMDGVLGSYSDASVALDRKRPDLCDHVV